MVTRRETIEQEALNLLKQHLQGIHHMELHRLIKQAHPIEQITSAPLLELKQ